jgi:hypothetical protein
MLIFSASASEHLLVGKQNRQHCLMLLPMPGRTRGSRVVQDSFKISTTLASADLYGVIYPVPSL